MTASECPDRRETELLYTQSGSGLASLRTRAACLRVERVIEQQTRAASLRLQIPLMS